MATFPCAKMQMANLTHNEDHAPRHPPAGRSSCAERRLTKG